MSLPQHLQLSSINAASPHLVDQLHHMQNQEVQSCYQATDYLAPPRNTDTKCSNSKVPTSSNRTTMCNWTYQIVDACSIDREIACIAMTYCDRFMSTATTKYSSKRAQAALTNRRDYQLACIACLMIALKCRAGMTVDADFVSDTVCQGMYQPLDIVEMEHEVLTALEWRLSGPSPQEFIGGFMELLPNSVVSRCGKMVELLKTLAKVHVEQAMLDYDTAITSLPSSIAFGALMTAMSRVELSEFQPLDQLAWMQNISIVMDSNNASSDGGTLSSPALCENEMPLQQTSTATNNEHYITPTRELHSSGTSCEKNESRRCSYSPGSTNSSCTFSMVSLSEHFEDWDAISIEL